MQFKTITLIVFPNSPPIPLLTWMVVSWDWQVLCVTGAPKRRMVWGDQNRTNPVIINSMVLAICISSLKIASFVESFENNVAMYFLCSWWERNWRKVLFAMVWLLTRRSNRKIIEPLSPMILKIATKEKTPKYPLKTVLKPWDFVQLKILLLSSELNAGLTAQTNIPQPTAMKMALKTLMDMMVILRLANLFLK